MDRETSIELYGTTICSDCGQDAFDKGQDLEQVVDENKLVCWDCMDMRASVSA